MWGQRFIDKADELFKLFESEPEKLSSFESICNGGTYEEMFAVVWGMREVHQIMEPTLVSSGKSEMEATRLRNEGNAYYKLRNFEKALKLYNLSIMSAPHPALREASSRDPKCDVNKGEENDSSHGTEFMGDDKSHPNQNADTERYGDTQSTESDALAMGYANRSAIMFELNVYDKCLEDIEMALKYGYPEKRRPKLEARREKCLDAIENLTNKGTVVVSDRNEPLQVRSSKPEECEVNDDSESKSLPLQTSLLLSHRKTTPHLNERKAKFPALSSALDVSYAPVKGRGFIAARDIRPGEVLAVERAHSVSLDPDKLADHCSSCLHFSLKAVPCPTCPKVIYCSEACRLSALTEEHWIECAILPSMISMELSANKNLAYKILRGIPYSRLTLLDAEQRRETNEVCPEELGLNDAGMYTSESSEAIRHLCTNVELFNSKSLFMHSLVALVMTKLLEKSGRFFISAEGNEAMTPSDGELIKTGALLLSNLLKIQINCYGVEHEMKRIGAGIYPTLSLVNHSCNPSAKHYTRGRNMILRAVRPIAAGEEVTISYTPDYLAEEREKRRKHLTEKYHIACECDACQFEWQTASKLPALMLKCFRCTQSVSGDLPVCYNCRLEYKNRSGFEDKMRFDTIAKQVDATFLSACKVAQKLMRAESISEEEYQSLCTATEFIHEHAAMPCQVIYNMERILEKCFNAER